MAVLATTPLTAAQQAANTVRQIVQQQFKQLALSGIAGYRAIWNNPSASPADVIAALGTDAVAVFQLAELNISTVTSAATIGGTVAPIIPAVPAGYTLTPNQDGSMTLTQNQT